MPSAWLSWYEDSWRHRSGLYYGAQGLLVANQPSNNVLRLAPLFVGRTSAFDQAGLEVTAAGDAGSVLRAGVYADDGTGYPGSLVAELGTLATSAIANVTLAIALTLAPGLYWIGGAVQGAPSVAPTLRSLDNQPTSPVGMTAINDTGPGYLMNAVSGALPAAFTTSVGTARPPRLLLRAA